MPEAGETKGLLLALDGHSDLVTPSSVTEAFRVSDISNYELLDIVNHC